MFFFLFRIHDSSVFYSWAKRQFLGSEKALDAKQKYTNAELTEEPERQRNTERIKRFVYILFFRFLFQSSFIVAFCIFGCVFVESKHFDWRESSNKVLNKFRYNKIRSADYNNYVTLPLCIGKVNQVGNFMRSHFGSFFLFCYCCYSPFCLRILFFHLHWDYSRIYLMRRSDTRKYPPAVSFDELIEWVLLSQSMSIAVLIFSPDYLLNLTFIWELLLSAYMQIWCLCTFRVCIHVYCVLRTDTRRRAKT